jgi:hypothetical protein
MGVMVSNVVPSKLAEMTNPEGLGDMDSSIGIKTIRSVAELSEGVSIWSLQPATILPVRMRKENTIFFMIVIS